MSGFRRDRSVTKRKLAPGTFRRIITFAAPYRRELTIFLALILFDTLIMVVNPLILKRIIDDGVANHNTDLVTRLAMLVASLAIIDAAINLVQQWYSARIGKNLIYDMQTK